jgi:hypothetical protein
LPPERAVVVFIESTAVVDNVGRVVEGVLTESLIHLTETPNFLILPDSKESPSILLFNEVPKFPSDTEKYPELLQYHVLLPKKSKPIALPLPVG